MANHETASSKLVGHAKVFNEFHRASQASPWSKVTSLLTSYQIAKSDVIGLSRFALIAQGQKESALV